MPYLEQAFRDELDREVGFFNTEYYVSHLNHENFAGAVNYINFRIAKARFGQHRFRRYWQFALWVGTMICCVLEVYRRLIAGYEDEAIKKNGDV